MRNRRQWLSLLLIVAGAFPTVAADPVVPAKLTQAQRATEFAKLAPVPEHSLLASDTLPAFEFAEPKQVRELIGTYRLKAVFHDPDFQIVTKATKPGRYGAVVEISPGPECKLPPTRRFFTLYRLPDRTNFETQSPALVARLKARRWNFIDLPMKDDAESARELAGYHEVPKGSDPDSFYQQAWEKGC